MITESALRQALASYLSGELSLAAFDDWIAVQTWDMHRGSSEQAQKLAGAIELRLAEHSAGHLSGEELRSQLQSLLREPGNQVLVAPIAGQQSPESL